MEHIALATVTPPSSEPVDTTTAAEWLRVDGDDDDSRIAAIVSAARELFEVHTGRAIALATFRQSHDRFPLLPNSQYSPGNPNAVTPVLQNVWPLDPSPWAIKLLRSPLVAGSVTIQYYDVNGTLQTMDPTAYVVDADSEPPRLAPASGAFWPSVQMRPGAVQVTYTAGYASAAAVPPTALLGIKMLLGAFYDNPNAVGAKLEELPMGIQALIAANRVAAIW